MQNSKVSAIDGINGRDRQQNDAADAEAICEAASRPTMRFVAVKTEEQSPQIALAHLR